MTAGSLSIQQRIQAPVEKVAAYVVDFRNAEEWMAGVEGVKRLAEDSYRLSLRTPLGRMEPEVRVVEHGPARVRWVYTSKIEGGGGVEVSPDGDGTCVVSYTGEFRLKLGFADLAARFFGAESFARENGERSLMRLKHLMEARR
jgi:carbon monoxide dehydrogenase subunit G